MATKVNRGKEFEKQIEEAFMRIEDTTIVRLQDAQAGYLGVNNLCDYIVYHFPHQFYVECKSCYGNTLSIHSNNPKNKYGAITNAQFDGLLTASTITGVVAGIYVWFIDHDTTLFIPIQEIERQVEFGNKSINIKHLDALNYNYYTIPAKKRRVLFDYDLTDFVGA